MNTKIYGSSDDLVEIEGAISDEHQDYSAATTGIRFSASDGTSGVITYAGDWEIEIGKKGNKFIEVILAVGEDNEHTHPEAKGCTSYSDILLFSEGLEWVKIGKNTYKP